MKKIVVIGAGIGGLTAAAILSRAGLDVTILEAQVYPGGCASTFYHQGYRFDTGATLAGGFYSGGPMELVAQAVGITDWQARLDPLAMTVHLPDGIRVPVWGDERRWEARLAAFGSQALPFWHWQESSADAMWNLALRLPPWPPQTLHQWIQLGSSAAHWALSDPIRYLLPRLLHDSTSTLDRYMPDSSAVLRSYLDAQLLISAQTTSRSANALYAASALDLPRRGVAHLPGGMGSITSRLVDAFRRHAGQLHFRQTAERIERKRGRIHAVYTQRGERYPADLVIANLPPWNIVHLEDQQNLPHALRSIKPLPPDAWGAFMLYLGVDGAVFPEGTSLHHQVVVGQPLGEGNSIFLSISPEWDSDRAPQGMRAITISTHTRLDPWWRLFENDQAAYEERRQRYRDRLIEAAGNIFSGIRQAARLVLTGTPVTFQRFTRRDRGWVGGIPQTSILRQWGPRLNPGLWMVGDSIFPGQSTAAAALGGMRVANIILAEIGLSSEFQESNINRYPTPQNT